MPPSCAGRLFVLVLGVFAPMIGCGSDPDDSVPVLLLETTGPEYTAPLAPFLYTVVATNNGDDLSGARFVDQLPPQTDMGLLQVNFTAPWSCSSDLAALQVTCTADTFATGSTEFEIFGLLTDTPQPGDQIENTVTLSADGVASATSAWSSEVLPPTEVAVTKSAPETAVAGESIRYDLTFTNVGAVLALVPNIQEHLPLEGFPTSYSAPPGWECEFSPVGPAHYFCQGPDLKPGDSAAVSITVEIAADAEAGTILTNRIVGLAQNSDGAEATATTVVVQGSD